jgi:hypothetical protein
MPDTERHSEFVVTHSGTLQRSVPGTIRDFRQRNARIDCLSRSHWRTLPDMTLAIVFALVSVCAGLALRLGAAHKDNALLRTRIDSLKRQLLRQR